jgi:hypothetical protein
MGPGSISSRRGLTVVVGRRTHGVDAFFFDEVLAEQALGLERCGDDKVMDPRELFAHGHGDGHVRREVQAELEPGRPSDSSVEGSLVGCVDLGRTC